VERFLWSLPSTRPFFFVAIRIGSTSLLADSAEFFEDDGVNLLIFLALGWAPALRARVGMALSAILLLPAIALLQTLWWKLAAPVPPKALSLTITGAGALIVSLFCALRLARWRDLGGGPTRAAFLSARNDAVANVGVHRRRAHDTVFPALDLARPHCRSRRHRNEHRRRAHHLRGRPRRGAARLVAGRIQQCADALVQPWSTGALCEHRLLV
jgi:hypothetical protein